MKKPNIIQVVVTDEEKELIEKSAEEDSRSVSSFVKVNILKIINDK